ncbi:MAG: hypothetical protein WCE44_11265 [Candidatus Velthaea sp.]
MADDKISSNVVCSNSDCRVAETGKCIEGLDLTACSHYGHAPEEQPQVDATVRALPASRSTVLPGADTLTTVEVSQLLRAGKGSVIAIIGPTDAGKTSLIASLYDLFQKGPVSGINFGRSLTLHAFEQTCHDARAASRRHAPHINRTPRGDVRFYHIDLGGGPAGDGLTLVLGDRAGEEYRSAADDVAIVESFEEIRRADSLTVLVDGERFLNSGDRHNVRSEITMMLQALVDGGAVQTGQRLALVLTKVDVVQVSPNQVRAESDFCALLASLRKLFGHVFSAIEPFRIAASPKTEAVPRGTGVPELLDAWIKPTPAKRMKLPDRPVFSRAFARLTPADE